MQTLQLLGGPSGRAAFLRARAGASAAPEGGWRPRWPTRWTASTRSTTRRRRPTCATSSTCAIPASSSPSSTSGARAAIHRRREIIGPGDSHESHDVVVELDRVSADEVATEAAALGFTIEPHRFVAQTEQYLGSTVVVLRSRTGRSGPSPPTARGRCTTWRSPTTGGADGEKVHEDPDHREHDRHQHPAQLAGEQQAAGDELDDGDDDREPAPVSSDAQSRPLSWK